jgi:hypothetical protein
MATNVYRPPFVADPYYQFTNLAQMYGLFNALDEIEQIEINSKL